jgi:hypothetical protein
MTNVMPPPSHPPPKLNVGKLTFFIATFSILLVVVSFVSMSQGRHPPPPPP